MVGCIEFKVKSENFKGAKRNIALRLSILGSFYSFFNFGLVVIAFLFQNQIFLDFLLFNFDFFHVKPYLCRPK